MDANCRVEILSRPKGSGGHWTLMSAIKCGSPEDAKAQIRKRSDALDRAFEFAIRTTRIEEYSERNGEGVPPALAREVAATVALANDPDVAGRVETKGGEVKP